MFACLPSTYFLLMALFLLTLFLTLFLAQLALLVGAKKLVNKCLRKEDAAPAPGGF